MQETAPTLCEELLERRMVYKLESAYSLLQTVEEPEDYPILDSACKDYLYMRYVNTQPHPTADSSHVATAIYRRQQSDPWASQSNMPTCTDRQTEGWSAAGQARSLIAELKVCRCKRIYCTFEFLPESMDLGCEKHRRLRHTIHMTRTKATSCLVETPFESTFIDQHCCSGRRLILTAVDADLSDSRWETTPWRETTDPFGNGDTNATGLSHGLQNFARGLAVFGRILEEQYAVANGTALQYDAARFREELDVALLYLRQRMESLLEEDETSADEATEETPCDQQESTKELAVKQDLAVDKDISEQPDDPTQSFEQLASNRLDDAAQQALLLEAAISSTLAPWDLPRTPPSGDLAEDEATMIAEENHPAFRSQSAMEAVAYGYLEHHLPGFGESNWRSEHRETFLGTLPEFAANPSFDTPAGTLALGQSGFAFEYEDRQGLLTSDGTPRRLLIGVKGNASRPFELTAAEHAMMQRYTQDESGASGSADGRDTAQGSTEGGAAGLLSGIDVLPTEFVLLHLRVAASNSQHSGGGQASVTVSHAVHDPHQAGLAVEPATFQARW